MASKKTTKGGSTFIAGQRPARYGEYWVGPQDYEVGPDMMHAPGTDVTAHGDRVKTRKNQRLAPLNHEVAGHVPDETPQN